MNLQYATLPEEGNKHMDTPSETESAESAESADSDGKRSSDRYAIRRLVACLVIMFAGEFAANSLLSGPLIQSLAGLGIAVFAVVSTQVWKAFGR